MKSNAIPMREWLSLIGMTVSAFIFNTSEFMPIGLLTDIGHEFSLTEAQAGIMITAYAWVVAIFSLPFMLAVSKVGYRKLLLSTIAVFGIGQALSCVAPNYPLLVCARLVVAASHCIFWSIAAPIASQLVTKEHRPLAISMIATGTSIAVIFGLPLGRLIGIYLGWRITFLCVAVVTLLSFIYLWWIFPRLATTKSFSLKELPRLFHNKALLGIYILTFLYATSYYTGYSYIEPFLLQVAQLSDDVVTIVLTIFGAAGLIGSFLCSKFYNHFRFKFIRVIMTSMAIALLLLYPAAGSVYTIIALCIFWGIAVMMYNVVFQAEVIQAVGVASSAVAMSMYSGIFNLGIGSGTWLGGMVVTYGSLDYIGDVGGVLAIVAALFAMTFLIRELKREKEA